MTDFVGEKKKQKKLIYAFVAVVIITVFVLWYGPERKQASPVQETPAVGPEFGRPVEIDLNSLENPIVKGLKSFEAIKPFEQEVGRQNPFLPY